MKEKAPWKSKEIHVSKDLSEKLHTNTAEIGQVTIHIRLNKSNYNQWIRAWKTTFLIPKENPSQKSKLSAVDNISMYPHFTKIPAGKSYIFTYIFTGLPKGCKVFDLIEDIPETGAFIYRNINRNKTDVYYIEL